MSAVWPSSARAITHADLDDPGEHVGQRQEEQCRGVVVLEDADQRRVAVLAA